MWIKCSFRRSLFFPFTFKETGSLEPSVPISAPPVCSFIIILVLSGTRGDSRLFYSSLPRTEATFPALSHLVSWGLMHLHVRKQRSSPGLTLCALPSHYELGDLVAGQVQGEVFVGSFDGKRVLLARHAGALIGEGLVSAAIAQLLGAAERVTVCSVLAELRPLQAVLLIEPDVVKRLAVPVGGRRRLPARRGLQAKATNQISTQAWILWPNLEKDNSPTSQMKMNISLTFCLQFSLCFASSEHILEENGSVIFTRIIKPADIQVFYNVSK